MRFSCRCFQQVDDLCLDGHVQCGDRLVTDNELRVQGQGAGDADTLALAAGELVGIAGLVVGLQAAVVHDLVDIIVKLILRYQVVLAHSLADDLADGQTGRQAGERVLEDDLHLGAQCARSSLAVQVVDFFAVEQHLAAGLIAGQAQDGAAGGGLAAAGLAHQAHGAAAAQVEGNAVHGLDMAHCLATAGRP